MLFSLALASLLTAAMAQPIEEGFVLDKIDKRQTQNGVATVYTSSGSSGSCGGAIYNSDYKVALSNAWMDNESPGPYCGRQIQVTNTGAYSGDGVGGQGNTITVTVEDTCPGCSTDHIDLTVAAWNSLTNGASYSEVDVTWSFLS